MDAEELKKSIIEYLDNTNPSQTVTYLQKRFKALLPYLGLILSSIIVISVFEKNPELSIKNIGILLFATFIGLAAGFLLKLDFYTKDEKYKLIRAFLEDSSCEVVNQTNKEYTWITFVFFVTPKQIVIFENYKLREELKDIIRKLMHYDYAFEIKARLKMFNQSAIFMTTEIQNVLRTNDETEITLEEKDFEELKKRIAENKIEEALNESHKFIQKDEKRNELVLLSSQFRAFKKEADLGKISIEDFNTYQNRITSALLNFIDENKKSKE